MSGPRRTVPALALLLIAAVMSGCVAPPDSGPIRPGIAGPVQQAQEPLVRPIANPPREGMQPLEIAAGFLAAAAAVGEDLEVARAYLTAAAAAEWDPRAGATLFEGEAPTLTESAGGVAVQYLAAGAVSSSGVLTQQDPVAAGFDLPMQQVEGQWRIAQAPPGLLLSRGAFAAAYTTGNAYFLAGNGRWVVPDARAVPRIETQALATALMNGLLAGPSDWIAASTTTAIPAGLQLALGAVPVVDAVARVELVGPEPLLDETAAQRFGAQVAWTLRQLPGIAEFEVSVNGNRLPLTGGRGPIPLSRYDSFNPDVLIGDARLAGIAAAGEPVEVVDGELVPFSAGTGTAGAAPALASIAVSPTAGVVAGAAADRTAILIGSRRQPGAAMQVLATTVASPAAVDGLDRVWWVDGTGRVVVATPDAAGVYVPVYAQIEADGPVLAVKPARDGSRAVLILGDGAQAHLAAVRADGGAIALSGVVAFGPRRPTAAVAWRSADEVTVLVPGAEVVERLDLLGRSVGAVSVPAGVRGLTDAPSDPLVLALADGSAGPLLGGGVRPIPGLTAPAYPG